jgi:sirohydrochlorin ferrochelatase
MITALLIIAHGSPREESNEDVYSVASRVRETARFDRVHVGFLDCNEPDIAAAARECVNAGAGRVVCVPYFLHLGRHVALDIPQILLGCAAEFADVEFLLTPLIGTSATMTDILLQRAREALARELSLE